MGNEIISTANMIVPLYESAGKYTEAAALLDLVLKSSKEWGKNATNREYTLHLALANVYLHASRDQATGTQAGEYAAKSEQEFSKGLEQLELAQGPASHEVTRTVTRRVKELKEAGMSDQAEKLEKTIKIDKI